MDVIKKILSVLIGLLSGILIISLGEYLMEYIYPMPDNIDINNAAQLADYIKEMPVAAYVLICGLYVLAAFFAGLTATALNKRNNKLTRGTPYRPALICGIVLTVAGLYNAFEMGHPWWFYVIMLAISIPAAMAGYLALRRLRYYIKNRQQIS